MMAFLSGSGEILFPVLLVIGLATRFAALGLLCMTTIVELTVPDGWPIHITWAAMALGIMCWGSGRGSIDYRLLQSPQPNPFCQPGARNPSHHSSCAPINVEQCAANKVVHYNEIAAKHRT